MTSHIPTSNGEPSVMEIFILALIDKAGLTSLYAFQQQAGLQPGGIRSTLERLEERGLIERAESSARRRRDFSLTVEGLRFLEFSWQQILHDQLDTEAALRAACVALLMGPVREAIAFLEYLSTTRRSAARDRNLEAEQLGKTQKNPLTTYAWMRALTDAQRRSAESEAFSQLSQQLEINQDQYGTHK